MLGRDKRSPKTRAKEIAAKVYKSSKQVHKARKAKKADKKRANTSHVV